MDALSLLGVVVATGAILFGQHLEGGHVGFLVNGPAMLIVLGGTLGATMLQSPMPIFSRSLKMFPWLVRPPVHDPEGSIEQILEWSRIARREGLLGLEKVLKKAPDGFLKKALALVVDGNEPSAIRETLELDSSARETRDLQAARVFDAMGGYAPTIGIIGAVMGLIHVMNNLADPSQLGPGIAVAFVATIYGVGLANLLFLPAANKLKALVIAESQYEELITVGIVGIAEGENPRVIQSRLSGLIKS